MGVTTFIYLTNILLNFISALPLLFLTALAYFLVRFIFASAEGAHKKTYAEYTLSYILFSKKIVISLLLYMTMNIVIPTKEIILTNIEFYGSEMFEGNQNEALKFYEFMNRMK